MNTSAPRYPSSLRARSFGLALALLGGSSTAFAAGDADHGKIIFQQSCATCHAATAAQVGAAGQGPLLAGVVGRNAGSLENFGYTKALAHSNIKWDANTLNSFLKNPGALVPGTAMVVSIPNDQDREDVVAYLQTLHTVPKVPRPNDNVPSGNAPLAVIAGSGDWRNDQPGVEHRIDLAKLPMPFATESAGNGARTVDRPADAHLSVPDGFTVQLMSSNLVGPRSVRVAPNGDIFITESSAGRIHVLRAPDGADKPEKDEIYATGLTGPWGLAFYPSQGEPKYLYVGNRNSIVRFAYRSGDLKARGEPEVIVEKLSDTTGGHTTRDVVFSPDDKLLYIAVGSGSNVAEEMAKKSPEAIQQWEASQGFGAAWGPERNRANILVTDPEGHEPLHTFATGIRNPVGIAINPTTGELWAATNERDGLGDDLVPDYITHVQQGGFYGWPWYYLGNHEDPRHAGERPDLANKAIVPDVPIQAHSASLEIVFYPQAKGVSAFPADYQGDAFAALHGSWNRSIRTGSKVVRVHFKDGHATGSYEDFLTGFVVNNHDVWGRPSGVAVAHDGALLVVDDSNSTLWRVSYTGGKK
ncbi:MAG TPA: PQQ-dependent sugar dehydrogenase [Opitutaceae bacterium]